MQKPKLSLTSLGRCQIAVVLNFFMILILDLVFSINLIILLSPYIYNQVMRYILNTPAGLFLVFLFLVLLVLNLKINLQLIKEIHRARVVRYLESLKLSKDGNSLYVLIGTILILFGFLVFFVFLMERTTHLSEGVNSDFEFAKMLVETFSQPFTGAVYVVAVIVFGVHIRYFLTHSALVLGWETRDTVDRVRKKSFSLATLVVLIFLSVPIYCLLQPLFL